MSADQYLEDAKMFVGFATPLIKQGLPREQSIRATLYLALAFERLLKRSLWTVNPIFVLVSGDFKNAAPVLYKDLIVSRREKEIAADPNYDVISFRTALLRAKVFSRTANNHSQLLFTLSTMRDVIAHRPTEELDLAQMERLLTKDAIRVLKEYCDEAKLSSDDFIGPQKDRLIALSEKLAFEEEMEVRLSSHRKLWEARASHPEFIAQARKLSADLEKHSGDHFMYTQVRCPACGNGSVVRLEPEYDMDAGESYLSGVFADTLHCYYCDLDLKAYDELDFVNINELLAEEADEMYGAER